jgi:hypothetical protein
MAQTTISIDAIKDRQIANTLDALGVTLEAAGLSAAPTTTGTGAVVHATSPTLVTPTLGVAAATSVNKVAITAPATSATLTVANGKTLTASNTLTLAGTDATTITFQGTDTYVGRTTTDTLTNKTLTAPTLTTPAIGEATGTGITLTGYLKESVANALTATGTDRATALQLSAQINNVTTAAASTGVILPVGVVGMIIVVFNAGANATQVYASASETIDTVAGSTGVPLTNAKRAMFMFVAANTWISAQLGVVSA